MRGREFLLKDGYSFDVDKEAAETHTCLPPAAVEAMLLLLQHGNHRSVLLKTSAGRAYSARGGIELRGPCMCCALVAR